MPQTSPVLALPFIQPAQAQKHVTHNEAVELLDMIVQLTVEDFDVVTPPASPAEGETWALGVTPTGTWAGQGGKLASFRNGGWLYVTPATGWRAYGVADGSLRVRNGGAWVASGGGTVDFDNLTGVGVNATSDATNRLAVAADASLFNHDGSGHQMKLNKSGAADTVSLLYQTGFSGRAEMGLAGNDNFSLKVSADGSTWFTALAADPASGVVAVPQALHFAPQTTPATAAAGDVHFDSASNKLRCFDGTVWQDLF